MAIRNDNSPERLVSASRADEEQGFELKLRPRWLREFIGQKKAKEQAEMLKSVRPGDKVVTTSGIIGVVVSVKDKTISLRSADAKMEVTKSSVVEILERGGDEKSAS